MERKTSNLILNENTVTGKPPQSYVKIIVTIIFMCLIGGNNIAQSAPAAYLGYSVQQPAFSAYKKSQARGTKFRHAKLKTCSAEKMREVLQKSGGRGYVDIDCNLTLKPRDVVYKTMFFSSTASGATINCNGATLNGGKGTRGYKAKRFMIQIQSTEIGGQWRRPERITIKKCNIIGGVIVRGWTGSTTEMSRLRTSKYVPMMRRHAPRNIVFDNITVTGVTGNGLGAPVYFGPGTTHLKLINSELKGTSDNVAMYLDAESGSSTIMNNYIHVNTSREVIAIDSSNHNVIINNRFSGLNHGGIYLYRNCGQKGTVRHTTPSYNKIINNTFYYKNYGGGASKVWHTIYGGIKPAVYLASRNGRTRKGTTEYCNKDRGTRYGSSASNYDYARHNIVMQNQIYKLSVRDMIRVKNKRLNSPNYIGHNRTVKKAVKRLAGCYVIPGGVSDFILHGRSIDIFNYQNGKIYRETCNNGVLHVSRKTKFRATKVNFNCRVDGENKGCRKTVSCRGRQKIVGATAACNLESGSVSAKQLSAVPANTIKIVRASDSKSRNRSMCFIGGNRLNIGQKSILGIIGKHRIQLGCKEHDKNGGDCHIKGTLFCH